MSQHVSVSQLTMFSRCGEQYRRRYVEGEIKPPGIALLVGSGVHVGAEAAMRGKADTGNNMAPNEVVDAAVDGFDQRVRSDGIELTKEERSVGRQRTIDDSRDRVATFSHYWACTTQRDYKPLSPEAVEWRFEIPLQSQGTSLVGVVDLVDDAKRIVDWKTGRRPLSQREADVSLQLTAYSLAVEKLLGIKPADVRLEQVQEGSRTSRNTLISSRSRADYEKFAARLSAIMEAIKRGSFTPCNPDQWTCDSRFCGYAETCPYYVRRSQDR